MAVARSFQQGLVGVFGYPVAENPTQAMLEPAFADMGLDWRYLTVEVRPEDLGDAVRGRTRDELARFQLHDSPQDRRDPPSRSAQSGGGVHRRRQLCRQQGRRADRRQHGRKGLPGIGFGRPTRPRDERRRPRPGGAARAIAVELALAGASRLTIVNRTLARAEELVQVIRQRTRVPASSVKWEGLYPVPAEADLVVNATAIGLFPTSGPVSPSRSPA